jgi:hypothetical protein
LADRYCRNCGRELSGDDRFCPNCGAPVHQAAHVPTPEADVPVPPPPQQDWDTTSPPPQQAQAPSQGRSAIAGRLFVGCLVVAFGLVARFVGVAILGGVGATLQPTKVVRQKERTSSNRVAMKRKPSKQAKAAWRPP